jgi:hypothetical protein
MIGLSQCDILVYLHCTALFVLQGSELPPGSSPTGRPPSSWLAASLYSVLTSLALLHESPLLLGRTHASLMSLNMAAIAARSKAGRYTRLVVLVMHLAWFHMGCYGQAAAISSYAEGGRTDMRSSVRSAICNRACQARVGDAGSRGGSKETSSQVCMKPPACEGAHSCCPLGVHLLGVAVCDKQLGMYHCVLYTFPLIPGSTTRMMTPLRRTAWSMLASWQRGVTALTQCQTRHCLCNVPPVLYCLVLSLVACLAPGCYSHQTLLVINEWQHVMQRWPCLALAHREVEVAEEELYEAEEALQVGGGRGVKGILHTEMHLLTHHSLSTPMLQSVQLCCSEYDHVAGVASQCVSLATQAGCEETLAAVQDALRCLQPTQVAVGYVQLAAAAAVGAMAQVGVCVFVWRSNATVQMTC